MVFLCNFISYDTIKIDKTLNSSFVGNLWIKNNHLYFPDSYFNYIFQFDKSGTLNNTFLGRGNGPNEIPDLDDIAVNANDSYRVLSSSSTAIYNFNESWNRINKNTIDFKIRRTYDEVLKNPEPSLPESYEIEFGFQEIMKNWDSKYVAIAVTASHPCFNGYYDSNLFYNEARILSLINKETGEIEDWVGMGRRPPLFLKKKNIPNFNRFHFEIDDNYAYFRFTPVSNMYVIDKSSKLAIGKFGKPGRDMKTN